MKHGLEGARALSEAWLRPQEEGVGEGEAALTTCTVPGPTSSPPTLGWRTASNSNFPVAMEIVPTGIPGGIDMGAGLWIC